MMVWKVYMRKVLRLRVNSECTRASRLYILLKIWQRGKMSVDDILGASFMADDDDEVRLQKFTLTRSWTNTCVI